jgi:CheY-like chemotaxis protein
MLEIDQTFLAAPGLVAGPAASPAARKRLFLVEDNRDNADLVLDLAGDQFQIDHFADGPSALAALRVKSAPRPDVFLLDISLPGMDGMALLHQIRTDPVLRPIPAVALTAHAMKNEQAQLLAAGFDGYFSKPITDEHGFLRLLENLT